MHTLNVQDRTIITLLKEQLKEKYGTLIDSVICYGSRVTYRKKDGDFDILILTSKKVNWQTENEISKQIINYGIRNDIVFDPKFYSKDEFENTLQALPFVKSIKAVNVII